MHWPGRIIVHLSHTLKCMLCYCIKQQNNEVASKLFFSKTLSLRQLLLTSDSPSRVYITYRDVIKSMQLRETILLLNYTSTVFSLILCNYSSKFLNKLFFACVLYSLWSIYFKVLKNSYFNHYNKLNYAKYFHRWED